MRFRQAEAKVYGAASWIATVAAVLVLGFVIAHWGWRWFAPAPPASGGAPAPERWAGAIIASPLFGRAAAPAAAVAPTAPRTPTTLQGDTRLLGVFAERGGAGFALFHFADRGPVLVKSGQEFASGVTLVEVWPDRVRIRDRGEVRDIALRAAASATSATSADRTGGTGGTVGTAGTAGTARAGAAARTACALPAGYKGPVYRLNAELLTGVASQPESWKALLAPVPGGLAVRDGSGFAAMLGMRSGDRVTQANGIALGGVDDLLVAFVKPLVASQAVHVAGTRDGKPAEWLFLNAGACPG